MAHINDLARVEFYFFGFGFGFVGGRLSSLWGDLRFSWMRAMVWLWICETRDSEILSTAAISFMVRFSW